MYLQPEKCVCCERKQNNCFQNIKRACFHKIRKTLFLAIKHSSYKAQYLTIWERAYYSITCFFSTFNEISRWVMISYSNNVVAFSFIWFYRSQIMCLITCAWFWSDWFFCFIFSVSKFYLFIFVVVASFLNHKQWSPKFLALGNQGDLSIPLFGEKFIGVEAGGTLELHGEGKLSWTKLQGTIKGFSAISSSFRHKVHVFQIYAGKSKYKLTSKDRSKSKLFFLYIF